MAGRQGPNCAVRCEEGIVILCVDVLRSVHGDRPIVVEVGFALLHGLDDDEILEPEEVRRVPREQWQLF